ncbi:unannotated protein [freshwater metagenome]|uniref:Unannotated protein n=1 Tax=freshwater metagenome TaxID=449393 RepID=A0A6J6NKC4_9ZZZZ
MRSTTVCALSISDSGTGVAEIPRADCARYERTMTDARARFERVSSSEISRSGLNPHAGASIAIADCTSTRTLPE